MVYLMISLQPQVEGGWFSQATREGSEVLNDVT